MQHRINAFFLNGPLNAALANAQLADCLAFIIQCSVVRLASISSSTKTAKLLLKHWFLDHWLVHCVSNRTIFNTYLVMARKLNSRFWKQVTAAPTASRL